MKEANSAISVRLEVEKGRAVQLLKQFGTDIQTSAKAAEKSMKGLGDEVESSVGRGQKAVDDFEKETKKAGNTGKKAFDKIDKASKKANAALAKSATRVKGVAAAATGLGALGFGAGLTGVAVSATKAGMTYETQMKTVQAVSRASEADLARLDAAARQMGETTEWSATQSAQALEYMAMAGYSVDKQISALPGMLNLATAAGMDLGQASDIVTDSLTAMGMGVEDLSRFNDVLIGTTTRANTNLAMMGESLKYSAPIAKQYGYDIETLSALIGTLANAGIKGSDAGTDLRQAMVRNTKAAKELGTAEDDLIGTLQAAKAAGWGVNEVTEKYGMIATKSVLVLMDQLDAYGDLETQLRDVEGETRQLAAVKLDTLAGDFKTLGSALEGVKLAAYDSLKGELRDGVQQLTEYVKSNKTEILNFVDTTKDLGVNLGKIGVHAATLFKSVVTGWNSLPLVIQEMGIVGALIGGAKARAALLLIGAAIGKAKELNDIASNVGEMPKLQGQLNLAQNRLKKLKEAYTDLKGNDVDDFGPGYLNQINEVEQRITELHANIAAVKKKAGWDIKNAIDDTYDLDAGDVYAGLDTPKTVEVTVSTKTQKKKKVASPYGDETMEQWAARVNKEARVQAIREEEAERAAYWQRRIQQENEMIAQEKAVHDDFQDAYRQATMSDTEYQLAQLKRRYKEYSKHVQDKAGLDEWFAAETKRITEGSTSEFQDAFTGWATGYSSTLNDMLWESEVTFDGILKSFLKMLTQMQIQKAMVQVGDWGSAGIKSIGSWITSFFHTGGIVGSGEGSTGVVQPNLFAAAPKFHTGLMPDEFPAILQRGEGVFTEGQMAAIGAGLNRPQGLNVKFEVINRGGQAMEVTQSRSRVDGSTQIFTVWLDQVSRNRSAKNNARRALGIS